VLTAVLIISILNLALQLVAVYQRHRAIKLTERSVGE
jgi:hypothetical protein